MNAVTSFVAGFATCFVFLLIPFVMGQMLRAAEERGAAMQEDIDKWAAEILARHQAGEL